MFANLANRLSALLVSTEDRDRDAYLASSADYVDLEHRIYVIETAHYPFTLYSTNAPQEPRI